jgi:hypothetical protein
MSWLPLKSLILLFSIGCQTEKLQSRTEQSRPTNEGEDVPGYLDSVERVIASSTSDTVILGNTTVNFAANSADLDYRVRLSRNAATPGLSVSASQTA